MIKITSLFNLISILLIVLHLFLTGAEGLPCLREFSAPFLALRDLLGNLWGC